VGGYMLVLDKSNRSEELLNIIKAARKNIVSWHLGYIKINNANKEKIEDVINILEEFFHDSPGVLFNVDDHKIIVIVETGPVDNYSLFSKNTKNILSEVSCNVSFRAITPDILDTIEADFVFRHGKSERSLYDDRLKRVHNKIIIVEDDAFAGQAAKQLLQKYGDVILLENGEDIKGIYTRINPDFVLMDIELQETNGLNLVEIIFTHDPDAFVVMLSGHSNEKNILQSCALGAAGFITKPIEEASLRKYMNQCTTMMNIF
jgi:CheY-like chemotaxis protein